MVDGRPMSVAGAAPASGAGPTPAAGAAGGDAQTAAAPVSGAAPLPGSARAAAVDFARRYPAAQAAINAIPDPEYRHVAQQALDRQKHLVEEAATEASRANRELVWQLAFKPEVKSMNDLMARGGSEALRAVAELKPEEANHLREYLDGKVGSRDEGTYGPGFVDLYARVHAAVGDPNRLTDPNALYPLVASGQLTVAGVDKLKAEIAGRHTVDGERLSEYRRQLLTAANDEINGLHDAFKLPYPKGKENLQAFTIAADQYIDQQRAAGKPLADIFNPQTKVSVYSLLPQFVPSLSERLSSLNQPTPAAITGGAAPPPDLSGLRSLDDFKAAVARGAITRDQAAAEALRRGLVRPDPATPSVPVR